MKIDVYSLKHWRMLMYELASKGVISKREADNLAASLWDERLIDLLMGLDDEALERLLDDIFQEGGKGNGN